MKSDTFYGEFMVKLVWRLSEIFMEKTRKIKLQDNLHMNFTINHNFAKIAYKIAKPKYFPNMFDDSDSPINSLSDDI